MNLLSIYYFMTERVKRPKLFNYRALMTIVVDDGRSVDLSSPEFLSCLTGGHKLEIKMTGEDDAISPGATIPISHGLYNFEYPIE